MPPGATWPKGRPEAGFPGVYFWGPRSCPSLCFPNGALAPPGRLGPAFDASVQSDAAIPGLRVEDPQVFCSVIDRELSGYFRPRLESGPGEHFLDSLPDDTGIFGFMRDQAWPPAEEIFGAIR